jgi:uncharacterized membrane protein YdbT with pleckstrin-like domain
MSEILYESHPSMIRMYPFGTVLAILLIPLGIGVLILLWWWISTKADKLTVKTDEIVWEHGLINKQYTELNMNALRSVRVKQSLLQRMLNAGDVEIYTAGDDPELVIKGLPDPNSIREHIKGRAPV